MDHPIKRLRHNIDSSEVRFEIEGDSRLTILDTLLDISRAFARAYEQVRDREYDGEGRYVPDLTFRNGQIELRYPD